MAMSLADKGNRSDDDAVSALARAEAAERELTEAGWTHVAGAPRWRPPVNHKVGELWRRLFDAEVERDALRRVDLAFQHFFRRVKQGTGKVGFPRFKACQRWNSFSIYEPGKCVRGERIRVSGVPGTITARNIQYTDGKIKQLRVVRRAGKWFAQLVVDDGKPVPCPVPIVSCVGIDVGLKAFATISNGDTIANPRFARKAERKLAHAHREVSRKVKGSRNRRKSVVRLQRVYERVAGLRSNFTHHASKEIVRKHQFIAVEDLKITDMVGGRFAKGILDAAWGQFTQRLAYKAESAGCTFVRVDPRGTTQECSQCGTVVPKDITVRVHSCPNCGLTIDRDLNAARNVLQRALKDATSVAGRANGNACGDEDCLAYEAGSPNQDTTKRVSRAGVKGRSQCRSKNGQTA